VLWRRSFTIMVMPDAQSKMRRLHVKGSHLVAALAGVAVLAALAVAAPLVWVWGYSLHSEVDDLRAERQALVTRAAEVETTIAGLRRQLDLFERRTEKLAYFAGLEMPSLREPGQGHPTTAEASIPRAKADMLRQEAGQLADRGDLLARRLETVDLAIGEQSERLSHVPSLIPVRGLLGSGFGWRRDPFTGLRQFHRGLDISAPEGTLVKAPAGGIVVKSEKHGGYGNTLYLSHGNGLVTRYGHLHSFKVRAGQKVNRGDVIALVGSSGRSTAPHLHYEVLREGKQVDPMKFVVDEGLFH